MIPRGWHLFVGFRIFVCLCVGNLASGRALASMAPALPPVPLVRVVGVRSLGQAFRATLARLLGFWRWARRPPARAVAWSGCGRGANTHCGWAWSVDLRPFWAHVSSGSGGLWRLSSRFGGGIVSDQGCPQIAMPACSSTVFPLLARGAHVLCEAPLPCCLSQAALPEHRRHVVR